MSKWISVKERLPEDTKLKACLTINTEYNKHHGIVLSRYYSPANLPDDVFRWCFDFGMSQTLRISHWMDLPPVCEADYEP